MLYNVRMKKFFAGKDEYAFSRLMYILEAGFEYFISLLITGAYLAKVTSDIGISDGVTGILTAFVSLGYAFQVFALLLAGKRPVKRWVTFFHSVNQLCFALVYLVPVFNVDKTAKTGIFILLLLMGYIISNVILSPKMNWFMELVDDSKKGSFTATKEIVSLIGGVITSVIASVVIDKFEEKGELHTAFIVTSIAIFLLAVCHTLTLVLSKEKDLPPEENKKMGVLLKELFHYKRLRKIIFLCALWNIATYITTPFYGSYQIKELGFSMTFVSVLAFAHAAARAAVSHPFGKYADKTSFERILLIGFGIAAVGFFVNVFTVPSNGKYLYTVHYILYAVSLAAISGGLLNLVFTEVPVRLRMCAYALEQGISGLSGFLASTLGGLLVTYVQDGGNTLFGISVYAQQVLSLLGALFTLAAIVWLLFGLKKERDPQ